MRINSIILSSAILWAIAAIPSFAQNSAQNADAYKGILNDGATTEVPLASEPSLLVEPLLDVADSYAGLEVSGRPEDSVEVAISKRSLPSLEEIQRIQNEIIEVTQPKPATTRRAFPSISIAVPTGYGAHRGQVFAGVGYQSRTRYSGGRNPGTMFGGGRQDGAVGIGFGIGDARESVGLQVSYTAASFGGSRAPLSGGFNAKIHKQFGNGWAAAVGGEGIINIGRLRNNNEVEYNDFENTYYGVVTKTFELRDYEEPFSRLSLTAGAGSGRFRSVDNIVNGEFGIGVFGSAALQVVPSTNVIAEWTGQDLGLGVSVAPFPNFPIVFTPAVRDIAGEGDGDPRFILGVGISVREAFEAIGL